MDDDYFIGKPIKKSDFFYYDEEQKKVLLNIVSDRFKEIKKILFIVNTNTIFQINII